MSEKAKALVKDSDAANKPYNGILLQVHVHRFYDDHQLSFYVCFQFTLRSFVLINYCLGCSWWCFQDHSL